MAEESILSVEFIYCGCGCGKTRSKYKIEKDGRIRKDKPRRFIPGHENRKNNRNDLILIEFVYCSCNCGFTLPKYDYQGRERRFLKGHSSKDIKLSEERKQKLLMANIGRKLSEEHRRKIGEAQKGEKNKNWLGDNVGYSGLHYWIRKHLPKSKKCHLCKERTPKEVACITSVYNREFKNWAWLCYQCHRDWDNIYERTLRFRWDRNKK